MSQSTPAIAGSTTTTVTTQAAQPVLHLRKHKRKSKVRWTEETVDNEHMNKKKTKICCIFHPQRDFGESSCSSSDSSESDASDQEAPGPGGPNAYEKQPKYN